MKVNIRDLKFIYSVLSDSDVGKLGFQLGPAELFPPFNSVGGRIVKKGNNYSGGVWLSANNADIFRNKSSELEIVSNGELWFPTSEHCQGYVVEAREPKVVVAQGDEEGKGRVIFFGDYGVKPRIFPDNFSDFQIDIVTLLEDKLNKMLNSLAPNIEYPIDNLYMGA